MAFDLQAFLGLLFPAEDKCSERLKRLVQTLPAPTVYLSPSRNKLVSHFHPLHARKAIEKAVRACCSGTPVHGDFVFWLATETPRAAGMAIIESALQRPTLRAVSRLDCCARLSQYESALDVLPGPGYEALDPSDMNAITFDMNISQTRIDKARARLQALGEHIDLVHKDRLAAASNIATIRQAISVLYTDPLSISACDFFERTPLPIIFSSMDKALRDPALAIGLSPLNLAKTDPSHLQLATAHVLERKTDILETLALNLDVSTPLYHPEPTSSSLPFLLDEDFAASSPFPTTPPLFY